MGNVRRLVSCEGRKTVWAFFTGGIADSLRPLGFYIFSTHERMSIDPERRSCLALSDRSIWLFDNSGQCGFAGPGFRAFRHQGHHRCGNKHATARLAAAAAVFAIWMLRKQRRTGLRLRPLPDHSGRLRQSRHVCPPGRLQADGLRRQPFGGTHLRARKHCTERTAQLVARCVGLGGSSRGSHKVVGRSLWHRARW